MESYILTTPCKNEEKNIPELAKSIINQTIKPKLWVIVDDGSTDSTPEFLRALASAHNWIYIHTLGKGKRDLSFHYAEVVNTGLNLAIQTSQKNGIHYNYLALIDADMILSPDFFEKIIGRFEGNSNLGIASGTVIYIHNGKKIVERGRNNLPIGGLRVWSKKCFTSTGGFPISYSADSVSNVLAIIHGWETTKFEDIEGIQSRKTSSAEGLWKGYETKGKSDYYRDYHPIYVIFKFLKYSFHSPFYIGIPYLFGYIYGIFKIKNKIEIPEVRRYYRRKHKEIVGYYGKKFKS